MQEYPTIHVIACDKRGAFAQGSASDEAIHPHRLLGGMDCFAALAMTEETSTSVIPGRATREPGISRHTSRFRIGPSDRPE